MRLVVVTQRVDPADPVLGATVAKIGALAARCDEVVVLTDSAVDGVLPGNCRVRLFAAGSRLGRGLRFEQALAAELASRPRPAAVLAHMCPVYAVLAAPLARPLGVRVMLWYAHWNRSRMLEAAVRASSVVVSVDRRSVPIDSPKVVGIGHGIELDDFPCVERQGARSLRAVALGRYSAAKGLGALVRGVALARAAGLDVALTCYGPTISAAEEENRAALEAQVAALGLDAAVRLEGPVARPEVPGVLAAADVLLNNMRSGAPDKAVYEACATCCPVLVSNPLFDELLEGIEPPLLFPLDDAEALAERLSLLAALEQSSRAAVGRELRARVLERHSVGTWAEAIVRLAQESASS